jgi:heat shock protein HslJ
MRSALFALLLLGACAQTSAVDAPSDSTATIHLSGSKWVRIVDMNANPHGATMDFEGNRASGYTGCNRSTAHVTQNVEQLRFGMTAVTEMACGAEVQMATERSFLAVIQAARYGHYDRDALVLLDARQNVIAEFTSTLPETPR